MATLVGLDEPTIRRYGLDDAQLRGLEPKGVDVIEIPKGQDFTLEYRIKAGDGHGKPVRVTLAADAVAGATSLVVKPDHAAIANGDQLLFGDNVVISAGAACAAGATALTVAATPCVLHSGDNLDKLQDLTGYTIVMEVLEKRGDATAAISYSGASITIATQSGATMGLVQIAGLAADTASLTAKSYYGALWRRNLATSRRLAEADVRIVEAGFL